MAIKVSTNFDVNAALPIDSRFVVADEDALGNIASPYEGMIVYLTDEGKFVYYRSGIYADLASGEASPNIGSYTWYIDTDDVQNKDGESAGTLSDCMTDDYVGTWFYVRTTSSEAGSAAYDSDTYTIDGANGYLSLRDYVIWTGAHLVHVPTYEAKSSTVKNSDGKYSPKSGVDGLMSSTDKAYLSDLIDAYWNTKIDDTTYNANECLENGLYAPVTLGRPSGVATDERLGVWVIKDKTNGGVVQIAISFNVVGRMWMRSSATNSADGFSEWKPVLSGDTVMPLFLRDNNGGNLPNWLIKTGVYHGVNAGAGGSPADFFGSENTTNWTIVVTVDPDDETHVTQRAYNNEDATESAMRTGTGSGGASMWGDWEAISAGGVSIADVQDAIDKAHTHDNKTVLDGIGQYFTTVSSIYEAEPSWSRGDRFYDTTDDVLYTAINPSTFVFSTDGQYWGDYESTTRTAEMRDFYFAAPKRVEPIDNVLELNQFKEGDVFIYKNRTSVIVAKHDSDKAYSDSVFWSSLLDGSYATIIDANIDPYNIFTFYFDEFLFPQMYDYSDKELTDGDGLYNAPILAGAFVNRLNYNSEIYGLPLTYGDVVTLQTRVTALEDTATLQELNIATDDEVSEMLSEIFA